MVFEYDVLSFWQWLIGTNATPDKPAVFGSLWLFILSVFVLTLGGTFLGYLSAAIRLGPFEAFYAVAKTIAGAIPDLVLTSPRRTGAIAWLAMKEAIRNKVLVVFAVFALILLFAGWHVGFETDHPAAQYLGLVLPTTSFLVLLVGLFLGALSLPNDIKNRTIYTIVTKPVRPGEIVLGRMIGFGAVGTAILACMYVVSLVFVYVGLRHTHEIDGGALNEIEVAQTPAKGAKVGPVGEKSKVLRGESSENHSHWHTVTIGPDGKGQTDFQKDHTHPVRMVSPGGPNGEAKYVLDPPVDNLRARVPQLGKLRFVDRTGKHTKKGINVGNEWMYRSYIEGGTLAAGVWTFQDVTPRRFPNGLPLELTLRVFRSWKGQIEEEDEQTGEKKVRRVLGKVVLRNPKTGKQSSDIIFQSEEFGIQQLNIPRNQPLRATDGRLQTKVPLPDGKDREVDLFADLADDKGELEVYVHCIEPGMYFGIAQTDVYLRRAEDWFAFNLLKVYYSIWLQLILVVGLGVVFSTFLSGPVAILTTVSTLLVGFFSQFIIALLESLWNPSDENAMGGGPIEAAIRLVTGKNQQIELDVPFIAAQIIKYVDLTIVLLMGLGAKVLPDFGRFDTSELIANGYSVFSDLLVQQSITAFGYVLVLAVLGYFFLRTREIAA